MSESRGEACDLRMLDSRQRAIKLPLSVPVFSLCFWFWEGEHGAELYGHWRGMSSGNDGDFRWVLWREGLAEGGWTD